MIIDQLPLLSGDVESTDEIPIERGTTTYKTTADKITVQTDPTPTQDSTKPVQSGGVYDALQTVQAAADAAQSTADGVEDSLATYPRPNLLENWYFVGGGSQLGYGVFPINQRGQTVYNSGGDCIDRWTAQNYVALAVNPGSIRISKSDSAAYRGVSQKINIPGLAGKKVTFSALFSSGTTGQTRFSVLDENNTAIMDVYPQITTANQVELSSNTFTATTDALEICLRPNQVTLDVFAVKLEIGSTQTLAHQESGVWVLNEVPSYGEEYAETVVSRKQLDWKLLWTNPNPSSAFAAQTISIDLSQYSEVRAIVKQATGVNAFFNFIGFVGYDLYADIIGTYTSGGIMILNRRQLTISTSGIAVTEGRKKAFNATSYTADNQEVILYQIFAR